MAGAISKMIESTINPSSSPIVSNSTTTETNQKTSTSSKHENAGKEIAIKLAVEIFQLFIISISSWYFSKWILRQNNIFSSMNQNTSGSNPDQTRERLAKLLMEREIAKEQKSDNNFNQSPERMKALKEKVRRKIVKSLDLNQYENAIAEDVIDPADIKTTFADVGGIDHIKTELWDLVVLPIIRPDIFVSKSGLVSPPRGILLFGAPGTGKIREVVNLFKTWFLPTLTAVHSSFFCQYFIQVRPCWPRLLQKKVVLHL